MITDFETNSARRYPSERTWIPAVIARIRQLVTFSAGRYCAGTVTIDSKQMNFLKRRFNQWRS
jgi:hypothetical protein